jgi:ornithine cyclodeaminase
MTLQVASESIATVSSVLGLTALMEAILSTLSNRPDPTKSIRVNLNKFENRVPARIFVNKPWTGFCETPGGVVCWRCLRASPEPYDRRQMPMGRKVEFRYLSLEDVIRAGATDMAKAIADVEKVLSLEDQGKVLHPHKTAMRWGDEASEYEFGRINCMPGYVGGDVDTAGIKWIGSAPGNIKQGLPRASALTILNDPVTKFPTAVMDGTVISAIRTGACGGVAIKYLAGKDAAVLGIYGAGVQSRTQMTAALTVRPSIRLVKLYDPVRERAQQFADEMSRDRDVEIRVMDKPEDAARCVALIITATMSARPVCLHAWMNPKGLTVLNIGGVEYDDDVVLKADKTYADSIEAVVDRNGDTIAHMINEGRFPQDRYYSDLGPVINGKKEGRTGDEFIYFASVGSGLFDIAVAARVLKEAERQNIGTMLTLWEKPWYS